MAKARLKPGGRVALVSSLGRERIAKPRINWKKVDATTAKDISRHKAADEREARATSAAYARRVRTRTKLTQAEFAKRIGVPLETVRNWEQGKRSPQGPARALLRVIDKAPDIAFSVLDQHRSKLRSPVRARAKPGER